VDAGARMIIAAEPIDAEAFNAFGDVLAAPSAPGRLKFGDGLANLRAHAKADLTMSLVAPHHAFPLAVRELERHRFSSQSFVPLSVSRWLVIVAPPQPDGSPDGARARAFVAGPGQGVTYRAGTWHHGLTVLDSIARFAVLIWRDGSAGDEEFVPLAEPFTVPLPAIQPKPLS
jgi:ureidoglycolate lyase